MATSEMQGLQEESGVARRGVSPQFSSASNLSSPPRSSPEPTSPSAQLSEYQQNQHSSITVNPPPGNGVGGTVASAEKPPRKKPGRKPGSTTKPKINPDGTIIPPKTRRPRKPKDPNAPPPVPKPRRRKNNDSDAANSSEANTMAGPPRQQYPGDSLHNYSIPPPLATLASQKGNNEDIPNQRPIQSFFNSAPPPPQTQPQPQSQPQAQPQPQPQPQQLHSMPQPPQPVRTSGQNYDPIRSNYDPVRETVLNHNSYNNAQGSPSLPHSVNRASASPSIASLVDPPNQALTSPSIATQSFFNQQQQQQQQQQARFREDGHTSVPPSPTVNRLAPSVVVESSVTTKPPTPASTQAKKSENMAPTSGTTTITKKSSWAGSTANSSAAASPKPTKVKDTSKEIVITPPPLPGSGLVGGTDGTEFRAPTIILSIPMNGEVNKYVNFSRMAEERYGWDALHPRLAAQRDRLARVAAAGAALERNGSSKDSGDEMSLDSDAEEGSNVEMGGMSDGRTGTDGGVKKVPRKRKMKEDEYDKSDGFVDDSELLWEEQAAAANDGFFVYSGPLVPEGEKPALDLRADGAPKRGRGRGSRGGARATGGRGGANAGRNGLPLSGPGSRGGSTTRKPRITKADRARMEQEKLEREKMGSMASMPGNYGGMTQVASAPQMGSTPMVFNQ